MKAGKYCFKDLFVNRYVQRIIIPEIQRDYVWREMQVTGLLNSLVNDYNKFLTGIIPKIETENESDIRVFNEFYRKRKYTSNIGFIYAYSDNSYTGNYFLIDGQQRVTTLYLLLTVLANRNNNLRDTFNKNYCTNNIPKLGYRVRLTADELLNKFIQHVINNNTDVNEQLWLLDTYKKDLTGKSIIENYSVIQKILDEINLNDEEDFFSYIEELTEFWYFDTNISEQGEELYIYMNARGEHMQTNENIKADLLARLENIESKNIFGEKWEHWQDFFWKNKGENKTSDKGFNQFLTCIAGLEYYLRQDESIFYSDDKFKGEKEKSIAPGISTDDVLKILDIKLIEKYFNAYKYLLEEVDEFIKKREYSDWVNIALKDFWEKFNNKQITNWFANYTDKNRNTERNNMVFIWSMLYYLKESLNESNTNNTKPDVIRFFRRMFIRYKNNNRSVTTIKSHVDITLTNGVIDETDNVLGQTINLNEYTNISDGEIDTTVLTEEEVFKNKILSLQNEKTDQENIEELIWQIEDHKFNIDGSNVGNTNITHLINISPHDLTLDDLKVVKDKFYEIFPFNETKEDQVKLIEVLLKYGEFYDVVSPYYYLNLKFNNWRRIIRNISTELKEKKLTPFKTFFNEFIEYQGSFDEFHKEKTNKKLEKEESNSIRERINWFSQQLGSQMWKQGFNIAVSLGNPCSLEKWGEKDFIFTDSYKYYNTKGDLKGGKPKILSNMIKNEQLSNEIK